MSKGDGCKSETETDAAERIQSLFPGGGGVGWGGGHSACISIQEGNCAPLVQIFHICLSSYALTYTCE